MNSNVCGLNFINCISVFCILGIILEYKQGGYIKTKSIDLLDLTSDTDPDELVVEIQQSEPLITQSRVEQVKELIHRLQQKQAHNRSFFLQQVHVHLLPLTNVAFNKSGSRFITGSYDRRCRVWDTTSGQQLLSLEGHTNIVAAVAFNIPYGDKIATGSFDRTCKLWCAQTGSCLHTLRGHLAEIRCLAFNPQSTLVATGSTDASAKLWDVKRGKEVATLKGHSAEILSLCFNSVGSQLVTGSSDQTLAVWDVATERLVHMLAGHAGEISNAQFNWDCSLIVSGSLDNTCKICFSPQGNTILTASSDKTARLWDVQTGGCLQILTGHTLEIFSCAFNYEGDTIITGSADNTCQIWRCKDEP
uniref:Dynein assembly factor with WDR repeat domains 1 n=1 Tax=Oryzias latipes TaxID=8090 RepID=A0A3B3HJD7_ORYLA